MIKFLRYSLRLRRLEYRVAELPIFLIPILLTVTDLGQLRGPVFWEGLFLFLFLFAVGDLVNCWSDRDLDAIYKPHLSEAVDYLSKPGVLFQAGLSALAAMALALHLALSQGRWLLLPATLLGNLVAWAYSAPPIRLKGRGLGQLGFYWIGLFVGPMLLASMIFVDWPPLVVWKVALAYGLLQTGVILVNTAEDFPEDRSEGVRTVVVDLGLPASMALASALAALGGAWLLRLYGGMLSLWLGLLPLVLAVLFVTRQFLALWWRMRGRPEAEQIQIAKDHGPLCPLWITSVALSTLWATVVFRVFA